MELAYLRIEAPLLHELLKERQMASLINVEYSLRGKYARLSFLCALKCQMLHFNTRHNYLNTKNLSDN